MLRPTVRSCRPIIANVMAHLDGSLMYQFRVPPAELNRTFRKWGVTVLIALVLAHLLLPNGISGSTAVLLAAIGASGYFYAKQHIWLTLSPDGICGTGYTNRKIEISWHDTISINSARMSDMDGAEIRTAENDGVVKKRILSLFIPRAISDTPEFSATVGKFAPKDHPLRTLSNNAP